VLYVKSHAGLPRSTRESRHGLTAALVTIQGARKEFRHRSGIVVALQDVSFDIRSGEFLSIVGPSGCGKSTLLGVVAGLTMLNDGTLERDASVERPGGIGMVFQKPVLLQWRTVLENIMMPAEILGTPRAVAKARAMELIELVGLTGFENAWPHQLSGGMAQRASICRALLTDPPLLLMDEPFGAVDAITRERLNLELQRLWSTTGNTVVFVTHSIEEAVLISDRAIIMTARPGKVAEIIDNQLPRPRDLDTMSLPLFSEYCGHIRHMLVPPSNEPGEELLES
jgi:NitT/TauT family transport system ATP-binding protein